MRALYAQCTHAIRLKMKFFPSNSNLFLLQLLLNDFFYIPLVSFISSGLVFKSTFKIVYGIFFYQAMIFRLKKVWKFQKKNGFWKFSVIKNKTEKNQPNAIREIQLDCLFVFILRFFSIFLHSIRKLFCFRNSNGKSVWVFMCARAFCAHIQFSLLIRPMSSVLFCCVLYMHSCCLYIFCFFIFIFISLLQCELCADFISCFFNLWWTVFRSWFLLFYICSHFHVYLYINQNENEHTKKRIER